MKFWFGQAIVLTVVGIIVGLSGCQKEQVVEQTPPPATVPAPVKETPPVTPPPAAITPPPAPVVKPVPAPPQAAAPGTAASIKFEKTEMDFGSVGPATLNNGELKFTNVGNAKLVVDDITSTCGCTVPKLDKKEYLPGESGIVKINFQAPAAAGVVIKHIYVVSNDSVYPRMELAIKALVAVKVVAEPNFISLRFDKDNAGLQPLKVRSLDGTEFSITNFTCGTNAISAEFDAAKKAVEHVLMPKVDIAKLQEMPTGAIQIGVNHPLAKEIIVTYVALEPYEISRPRIFLQNVEPGVPVVKDVWVKSNYGAAVEVESWQSRLGYMKIIAQNREGNHLRLDVEVTLPQQKSPADRYISDELTVKTKDGKTLTIRCNGWYKIAAAK